MRDVIDVIGATPNQCKLGDGGELKKKKVRRFTC